MELRGLDNLPMHMRDAVRLYVMHGISGGSFLNAVMSNQLVQAVGRADEVNAAAMRAWASWLYNDAPSGCWGSAEKREAWMSHGGISGLENAEAAQ